MPALTHRGGGTGACRQEFTRLHPARPDRHAAAAQALCRSAGRREEGGHGAACAARFSACSPSSTAINAAHRSIAGPSPRSTALWLNELRDHADPLRQAKAERASFAHLFHKDGEATFDALHREFPAQLPPQQRSTLLLVYGEGFDYERCRPRARRVDAEHDRGAADPRQREPCRSAWLRVAVDALQTSAIIETFIRAAIGRRP